MNSDIFEGKWDVLKGKMKHAWGKLTDDDFKKIEGNHDILCGRLQELYGYSKEEAKKKIDKFRTEHH